MILPAWLTIRKFSSPPPMPTYRDGVEGACDALTDLWGDNAPVGAIRAILEQLDGELREQFAEDFPADDLNIEYVRKAFAELKRMLPDGFETQLEKLADEIESLVG